MKLFLKIDRVVGATQLEDKLIGKNTFTNLIN